jgi:uncharacterized protein (TIGR02588 family)
VRNDTSQSAPASQSQEQQQRNGSLNGRMQQNGQSEAEISKAASPWEWVIAGAGALAILSLIGFFIYQGIASEKTPVDVVIQPQPVIPVQGGYLVPLQLTNRGANTAEGLEIEGELTDQAGTPVETSETSIDYLPPYSTTEGGLFFTEDPRQYNLQIRPKGYEVP